MHINFTEEEKEYLDIRNFKIKIKDGCPKKVRDSIEKKTSVLSDYSDTLKNNFFGLQKKED